MTTSSGKVKRLTIFEGPDGGGKSTMAREYATLTGALYIHHGPYKNVTDGLGRMVLESMLPALLGYQDAVLDRCWLSEPIYADAFRDGKDRLGLERSRVLDRAALRCGAVIVKCLPQWAVVKANFLSRLDKEYLDTADQLLRVYGDYQHDLNTALCDVEFDYTDWLDRPIAVTGQLLHSDLEYLREKSPCHDVNVRSSGNWNGLVVIVGEDFGEHKNNDAQYQLPFGSLNGGGCSLWLAGQLAEAGISERHLLWVNADELSSHPEWLDNHREKAFAALGTAAAATLSRHGVRHTSFQHPQFWKRFKAGRAYPLTTWLKETINEKLKSLY